MPKLGENLSYKPKDIFDHSIKRAQHFLFLYDILHDTRCRNTRSDWAKKFKEFMHWPNNTKIIRIDGKDKNSILVLKNMGDIDRKHFTHVYISELLRSSLVASVSSLDRYIHDLIIYHSWRLLSKKEEEIPKGLREIRLPILTTKKIIEVLRKNQRSRPGNTVKKALQKILHRDYTFQTPSNIDKATKILGIKDFWRKIAREMPGNPTPKDVREKLKKIAKRRNQIVHEADLILKTKTKKITVREIKRKDAQEALEFIKSFVEAFDKVILQEFG